MATRRLTDDEATRTWRDDGVSEQEIRNRLGLRNMSNDSFTNLLRSGQPMGTERTNALMDPEYRNPGANVRGPLQAANPNYLGNRNGLQLPDRILRTESGGLIRLPFAQPREMDEAARNPAIPRPQDMARGPSLNDLRSAPGPAAQSPIRYAGGEQAPAGVSVLDMLRARSAQGTVSQRQASGRIAQAQAQEAAQARAAQAAQQTERDRQFQIEKASAPARIAAEGAAARQIVVGQQYMDRLKAEGKVVNSPEYAATVKADIDKLEAAGRQEEALAISKAVLDSMTSAAAPLKEGNAQGTVISREQAEQAVLPVARQQSVAGASPLGSESGVELAQGGMTPERESRFAAARARGDTREMANIRREVTAPVTQDVTGDKKVDWQDHDAQLADMQNLSKTINDAAQIADLVAKTGRTQEEVVAQLEKRRDRAAQYVKDFQNAMKLQQTARKLKNPDSQQA